MSESQDKANKKYYDEMKELGLVRIHPFVPLVYKDEVLRFAKQVKNRYLRELKKRERENERKKTNEF